MPNQHAGTMEYGGCGEGKPTGESQRKDVRGSRRLANVERGRGPPPPVDYMRGNY
jgi:hypothetical protein